MATGAKAAYGSLLKIGDGGGTEVFTTVAEVTKLVGPKMKLDTKDVTSHSSPNAAREFIATLLDAGEVTADLNWIPSNATQSYSSGLLRDMWSRNLRNFQIVFSDLVNTTWTFAAFVVGFDPSAPFDAELGVSVTLKLTGKPTLA